MDSGGIAPWGALNHAVETGDASGNDGALPRVLVVDPDRSRAMRLHRALEEAGFATTQAEDQFAAMRLLTTRSFVAVLSDLSLPGGAGFALCTAIRTRYTLPILLIGASDTTHDTIRGVNLGADDCVSRAATTAEIAARVKAVLRRYRRVEAPASTLDFGRFVLNLTTRHVSVQQTTVHLAPREFDLLSLFATHPRQVFSREQLFERFWGGYGGLHTVSVHVSRIRTKIEETPARPRFMITIWGVGYRFEGAPQ